MLKKSALCLALAATSSMAALEVQAQAITDIKAKTPHSAYVQDARGVVARNPWGLCWRTLLALEVMFGGLGQQLGLGVLMQEDRMTYAIAEIWAILIVIMSVSVAVNSLFLWVKRRVHWT